MGEITRATDAERGAHRLLRLLRTGETALHRRGGAFVLRRRSPSASRQEVTLAAHVVELCLAQDWLERRGETYALSAAGVAWLRRSAASGEPFLEQHQLRSTSLKDIEGARRPVAVNEGESPLGWLRTRKDRNGTPLISDQQFEAGERLRADYWFAQLSPRVTANWSALVPSDRTRRAAPSNSASLRDDVIAAKNRIGRALDAVGPELSGVLIDICCELKGLEDAEKHQGWPQRAGKVVLQIALSRLARHYGLLPAERAGTGRSRLRHWGAEDYKPTLDAWRDTD